MTSKERAKFSVFLGLRSFVAVFDLLGILAIGFLATSIALFVTLGSDASRVIEFGDLTIPAVTAQTLPIVAAFILALFVVKAVLSILLTRQLAYFLARVEARASRVVAERAFGNDLEDARRFSRDDVYFSVQAGSPAAFNSVLNSVLHSTLPSTLPALPPLLLPILHGCALHLPFEKAIEEGDLAEAAGQGDIQDASITVAQFAAGGLEAQLIDERAEAMAGVLLELPGEGRPAKSGDTEQVFQSDLVSEIRYEVLDGFRDGLLVMRFGAQGETTRGQ